MIDYGTCPDENISHASRSVLDGIRVMVKKDRLKEALDFCASVKAKGYMVFVQPVSITGYSDEELLHLIELVNELEPFAMSIVDTYGLLDRRSLMRYFNIMDDRLKEDIVLGYHAHNNFQLAYSNSIALCEGDVSRPLLIDASAFGMGKSAGNCPLELMTTYANANLGKSYDTSQILEMIDTEIMKIFEENPWGYQMQYFLCAANDCHPKYSQYLLKKKTLSVKSVNEILSSIEPFHRLSFDESYIEKLYIDYQDNRINDEEALKELSGVFKERRILIIGPGRSISLQERAVKSFIQKNDPLIISINFLSDGISSDYLFLSNSKRYMRLSDRLNHTDAKIIATSNVTATSGEFDYEIDYAALIDQNFEIPDNSLPMFLRLLVKLGVKEAALAGFDGYDEAGGPNYVSSDMEYEFIRGYAVKLNDYTKGTIASMKDRLDVVFVTESKYEL